MKNENKAECIRRAINDFLDAGYGVVETNASCGHLIVKRGDVTVNYYPTTKTYYSNRGQNKTGRAVRGKGFKGAIKLLETAVNK